MAGTVQVETQVLLDLRDEISQNTTQVNRIMSDIKELSGVISGLSASMKEYNFILNEHHQRSTSITNYVSTLQKELELVRAANLELGKEVTIVKKESEKQAAKLSKIVRIYNFFAFLPSVIKYITIIAVAIGGTYTFMMYFSKLHGG